MKSRQNIIYFSRESPVYFNYMLPILKMTGGIFITESEPLYEFVRARHPEVECRLDTRQHLGRYRPGAVVLAGDERKIPPKHRLVQIFHGLADKKSVYERKNFLVRESLPYLLSRIIEHHLPSCCGRLSLLNDNPWGPIRRLRLDRLIKPRYSLFCLAGKHMEDKLRSIGILSDDNWARVGFPRLDVLSDNRLSRTEIMKNYNLDPDRKTIIYAPTWHGVTRINLSSIPAFGEAVCRAIDRQTNFIFKPHPNVIRNNEFEETVGKILNWIREHPYCYYPDPQLDIIPLMFVSDLMITDFSSVAVDYLAFDKPMIFLDHLGQEWNDPELVEVWIREAGEIVSDPENIRPAIDRCLNSPDRQSEIRRRFRDCFFYRVDGQASERAARAICRLAGVEPSGLAG